MTRKLFEGLIAQQREAVSSPQRVRGRTKVPQMKTNDGHQRVKEKRLRTQNPNSVFQQLLVRFDPVSFVNANTIQQVQS